MLKLTTPLMFMLLLPTISKNFWILSTTSLLILSMLSLTVLPAQITSTNTLSQLTMVDNLSSPLISLSLWITTLMIMASYKENLNKNKPKMFLTYSIILSTVLIFTFMSNNMIMFYICFEASLIPTMLLILGWGYQPERLQASMYLMLYTITASLPLLMSMLLMYMHPSNLSFLMTQWSLMKMSQNMLFIWWLITIMAFLVKMPLYMLHLWLPKAHVEAPVAGSMILAGILLKLGSYGLMRLSSMVVKLNDLINPIMMSLSLWGAVLTSMICVRQTDLKSLIAYSSIGHMSLLMAGLMSNSSWGWNASLTMMLAHGLCSSSLFALANMTYESTQTRSIFMTKGMMTVFPTMSMWWFMNCAMNMAAPPTTNLLSEMFLITGTISFSLYSSLMLFLLVFMAAAYSLHLYTSSQHGPNPQFSSPMNLLSQRNYTTILLHLLPATILILKSDTIMLWT